jgi:hypothetical protein
MKPLVKIVGECPFCIKGDEDKRHVKKILRNGQSEYQCGVGQTCIIVKLYQFADESLGHKDSEVFY